METGTARGVRVLVVGAGVIGLTVATALREKLPVTNLAVWAKEFPPNTTSNIAGGLVCPYLCNPPDRVLKWTEASFRNYRQRYIDETSGLSSLNMVRVQPCYEYFPHRLETDPYWNRIMPTYRRLRENELPPGYADGFVVDAMIVETSQILSVLLQELRDQGVTFARKELHSINEAFDDFDIVVNCTGLGSRWLVNDEKVYPLRGQIVRIRQVGYDRTVSDEEGPNSIGYIISRRDDMILGGTAIKDDWSTNVNEKTTDEILYKVENLSMGQLAKDKLDILEVLVGLRPARDEVRLEKEEYTHKGAHKTVIHNYGHGGSGWTVCWGCAEEVVALVEKELTKTDRKDVTRTPAEARGHKSAL